MPVESKGGILERDTMVLVKGELNSLKARPMQSQAPGHCQVRLRSVADGGAAAKADFWFLWGKLDGVLYHNIYNMWSLLYNIVPTDTMMCPQTPYQTPHMGIVLNCSTLV